MLFTAANSAGDTIIKGIFQAVLNTSNPAMQVSTLLVNIGPSMNSVRVECIDGLHGDSKHCQLRFLSELNKYNIIMISVEGWHNRLLYRRVEFA